jgi:hypothetical protein
VPPRHRRHRRCDEHARPRADEDADENGERETTEGGSAGVPIPAFDPEDEWFD